MKFRAVLRGVEDLERGIQSFGPSIQALQDWAKRVLCEHPSGRVEVHEITEVTVVTWGLVQRELVKLDTPKPEAPRATEAAR